MITNADDNYDKLQRLNEAIRQAKADKDNLLERFRLQQEAEREAERDAICGQMMGTIIAAFPLSHAVYGIDWADCWLSDYMLREFEAKGTFRGLRVTIGDTTFKVKRRMEGATPRVSLCPTSPWGRNGLTQFARFMRTIDRYMTLINDESVSDYFASHSPTVMVGEPNMGGG